MNPYILCFMSAFDDVRTCRAVIRGVCPLWRVTGWIIPHKATVRRPQLNKADSDCVQSSSFFSSVRFFFQRVKKNSRSEPHRLSPVHKKQHYLQHSLSGLIHTDVHSERSNSTVMRFLWMCQPALNIRLSCQATEPGMNS